MNIGGYIFQGPYDPNIGFVNDFAAIYAIVDGLSNLIDAGQSESINGRISNHDRKLLWPKFAQQGFALYVLLEPRENVRLMIESLIRRTYNPPCGDR